MLWPIAWSFKTGSTVYSKCKHYKGRSTTKSWPSDSDLIMQKWLQSLERSVETFEPIQEPARVQI